MAFQKRLFLRYISLPFLSFALIYLTLNPTRKGCLQSERVDKEHLIKHDFGELQACSAIIQGDMDGVDSKHFRKLLSQRVKTSLFSESFYINATKDCQFFVRDRGFLTVPLSKEERDFPIAYSMIIHEKIEMFERLLRAIYTPQNVYCVHVDKKSPKIFSEAVRAIVSCLPNVFVASKIESVVYASWSRVQADINCMEDLLKSPVRWRYLLNTCGADFPLKTNAELVRSLKNLNGKNSMESEVTSSYKKARWEYHHNVTTTVTRTDIKKTPPPIDIPMFSGNAYFVVVREFVEHIFNSPEIQNFMEWEKDTYSPDEHMWATLQRMYSVPGSNPHNEKYDESDMVAIARLVKWVYHEGNIKNGAPYPPCAGSYRHAVCVYGAGDLNWILKQKHLFANKFDPGVDDLAIKCLEAFLRYKAIYALCLEAPVSAHNQAEDNEVNLSRVYQHTSAALPAVLVLAVVLALGIFALAQARARKRLCWRQSYERLSGTAGARPDPRPMPHGVPEPEDSGDDADVVYTSRDGSIYRRYGFIHKPEPEEEEVDEANENMLLNQA